MFINPGRDKLEIIYYWLEDLFENKIPTLFKKLYEGIKG